MDTKNVCILVIADSIPEDVKTRFVKSIEWSKPQNNYEIIMMERERSKDEPFNKCVLLNQGLRIAFKKKFNVIIQTDIDLVVPPGAIDFTTEIASSGKCCCHLPMIRLPKEEFDKYTDYDKYPWAEWSVIGKRQYATGCWNGLTPKAWKISGGFNEKMTNWGFEDRDWRGRAMRNGIIWRDKWGWYKTYPLIHVNHPSRTPNNSQGNKLVANKKIKNFL